jgi:predicted permease
MRPILQRVWYLIRQRRLEAELAEEIDCHRAMKQEELEARGLGPTEATFAARRALGSVALARDRSRDVWRLGWLQGMVKDFRLAIRTLSATPMLSTVAVLSLALAIGVNATMFSVVDAVLFRPLPYPNPDRIVRLTGMGPQAFTSFGPLGFEVHPPDLRRSPLFQGIGSYVTGGLTLTGDMAERLRAASVTSGFFEALDVKPALGRTFRIEDIPQAGHVAVISDRLWHRRFGGNPAIVGRPIALNGQEFVVLGVLPPSLDFPDQSEVWIPSSEGDRLGLLLLKPILIARLAHGVRPFEAANEVARIVRDFLLHRGGTVIPGSVTVRVTPLRRAIAEDVRPTLLLVATGALLALLVACINAANVLLTRIPARHRDVAVRRALGASDLDLARQVLCESLLLSIPAGVLTVPVARWVLDAARAFLPATLFGMSDIAIDSRTITVTAFMLLVTPALLAWAQSRSLRTLAPAAMLRTSPTTGTADPFWRRFRSTLVVGQIAVALVLLVIGVNVFRKVVELTDVNLGVHGNQTLVVDLILPSATTDSAGRPRQFYQQFEADLREHAAVTEIAATSGVPGEAYAGFPAELLVDGAPTPPGADYVGDRLVVTPRYFAALGIDLLAGRTFVDTDRAGVPLVAIISEGFARKFGIQPAELVGRRALLNHEWVDIVGVVRDVRMRGPESRLERAAYVPFAQAPVEYGAFHIVVKGDADPKRLVSSTLETGARIDPGVPLFGIRTFEEIRARYLTQRRFVMTMMLVFGGLAFGLATVGLYGVITHLVLRRTHEIGLRMALGASPSAVKRQVLASGLWHALSGIGVGATCSLAFSQISTNIPSVGGLDRGALAGVAIALLMVSMVATWLPASRATKVDPLLALRCE